MSLSFNALLQQAVTRLETLTGESIANLQGASNHALLLYLNVLLSALESGGGGTVLNRDTLTLSTPTLAANAQHSTSVALGAALTLISVAVDFPARVRLYLSAAAQSADAGRTFGAAFGEYAPYILFDAQLPHLSLLNAPLGLSAASLNEGGTFWLSIDNKDTVPRAVSVTFTRLLLEPSEVF